MERKNKEYSVICPYCNREAPWVENKEKYGKNLGTYFMCYYCKTCDAYVGCRKNTREPLGTLANKDLRNLRKITKDFVDRLWINGGQREQVFAYMNSFFGFNIKINYCDEAMCERIISYAKDLLKGGY